METRGNEGNTKCGTESINILSPGSLCCLTENLIGRNISGELCAVAYEYWLITRRYSRWNGSFSKMYKLYSNESDHCKNITWLAFAKGPHLNQSERQLISSNNDEYNYWWQQILNGQYIKMSVNGASMIFDFVSEVIETWFGSCYAEPPYWQPL